MAADLIKRHLFRRGQEGKLVHLRQRLGQERLRKIQLFSPPMMSSTFQLIRLRQLALIRTSSGVASSFPPLVLSIPIRIPFHPRDAEFTEIGVFLDQELFTLRPQCLIGESSSSSRAYLTANFGVKRTGNRARHSIFSAPPRRDIRIALRRSRSVPSRLQVHFDEEQMERAAVVERSRRHHGVMAHLVETEDVILLVVKPGCADDPRTERGRARRWSAHRRLSPLGTLTSTRTKKAPTPGPALPMTSEGCLEIGRNLPRAMEILIAPGSKVSSRLKSRGTDPATARTGWPPTDRHAGYRSGPPLW